jgi:hypothetical protein
LTRQRDDSIAVPIGALRRVIIAIILVLVFAAVVVTQRDRIGALLGGTTARYIDANAFQAVFLSNSQVFFGKLTLDGDTYVLNDVFYVSNAEGQQTGGSLVKLGNEVHGPRDPIVIPAPAVIIIENLRDDSQVVQAIRLIKSGQVPPQPSPTPSPRASATR